MVIGSVVLFVGVLLVGFGLYNHLAARRVLSAPFKKTGELAKDPISPDPKGAMSTEGDVVAPATELLSPASQQPCLAYELKIERIYEKSTVVNGKSRISRHTETLETIKNGTVFGLDDGTGAISVDVREGAEFDNFKEGFKKELNGHSGASQITWGAYTWDVPAIGSRGGWTIGFKATERYVPVKGKLFVLGKLDGGSLVKPGWRSMVTSSKGREGLLGRLSQRRMVGLVSGALVAVLSVPVMIFGPQPTPDCQGALTDTQVKCDARVTDVQEFTWNVTKPGSYEITVFAMNSTSKSTPFNPGVIVSDKTGAVVGKAAGGIGKDAVATVQVEAGTYTLKVFPADHYKAKGGYKYRLSIVNPLQQAPGSSVARR